MLGHLHLNRLCTSANVWFTTNAGKQSLWYILRTLPRNPGTGCFMPGHAVKAVWWRDHFSQDNRDVSNSPEILRSRRRSGHVVMKASPREGSRFRSRPEARAHTRASFLLQLLFTGGEGGSSHIYSGFPLLFLSCQHTSHYAKSPLNGSTFLPN